MFYFCFVFVPLIIGTFYWFSLLNIAWEIIENKNNTVIRNRVLIRIPKRSINNKLKIKKKTRKLKIKLFTFADLSIEWKNWKWKKTPSRLKMNWENTLNEHMVENQVEQLLQILRKQESCEQFFHFLLLTVFGFICELYIIA